MSKTVDARGLSCPQPVMLTLDAIKSGASDEIIIMVDNETAKENVSRAAAGRGWKVTEILDEADGCKILIGKG
jgi:tRNA 2-thiouridine synthesizing protein A